ncbi:ATP-dependent RNA helicase dbp7 [Apiospora kogelbergensis]|uniref:ATP-dependent RNA helicase dbp7 n=1 Tax=Apiospora kogelbergensis TaxID=1337665 RepID=UPI003130427B
MADDGMLLNFDLGDSSLKSEVKFTGGRWRDRVRAQRSAKGKPSKSWNGANGAPLERQRQFGKGNDDDDDADTPAGDRPAKRQKDGRRWRQVTSRLFTSNPTAKTIFEDAQPDAEPAQPSNAPLTAEAENFHALGLSKRIAHHLSTKLEMKAPTSIQKNTIPQLVNGDSDAFLQAETAYHGPQPRCGWQQHGNQNPPQFRPVRHDFGADARVVQADRHRAREAPALRPWIVSTTVIGGESKKSEKARIRKGVNILIATPGRLTDHLDHTKVLDVGTVRWLVLDEGDRLMEMGFEDELKMIVGKIREEGLKTRNEDGVLLDKLPQRRVTVLCSATMKMTAQRLGEISLQDAVHVTASKSDPDAEVNNDSVFSAPAQLKQTYIITAAKPRLMTLIALLKSTFARKGSVMKAIIFISCADSVDFHFELLRSAPPAQNDTSKTVGTVAEAAYITSPANHKIALFKLHGSLQQPIRTATLKAFHEETDPCVLITTDIASRGLDVPTVDLVIEYDPAFAVDDHVHRIGRTARAGRPGKAVLFLQPGCEEGYLAHLQASMTGQSSESIIQKSFITPIMLPKRSATDAEAPVLNSDKSALKRAEALQLHIEQRLLDEKNGQKLLDAARQAFRSYIRAYATHVKDERKYFDIQQLHLGHTAKSFGLREAPGGIGGGPSRRVAKGGQAAKKRKHGDAGDKSSGNRSEEVPHPELDVSGQADEDAARRMRMKMKEVMNQSSEFNLG